MKRQKMLALLVLCLFALGTQATSAIAEKKEHQNHQAHAQKQMTQKHAAKKSHTKHVSFSYQGDTGPNNWDELDEAFGKCGCGKKQSPINLTKSKYKNLTNIKFHYKPSRVHILNNGHTIQVNYDPGSFITVNGKQFNLLQFHYHAPSEHAVGGRLYPIEMHLVHKSEDGELAVVGVFLLNGKENKAFAPVWENLPAKAGEKKDLDITINANKLLPRTKTTYRYLGSLTTPPCSEGVNWFVMNKPVSLSDTQISTFNKIYHGNNRPIQQRNKRIVTKDTTP